MQNDSNILIEKSLYPNQLNKLRAVGYLKIEKYRNFLFLISHFTFFLSRKFVNPFPNIDSIRKTHTHKHDITNFQ